MAIFPVGRPALSEVSRMPMEMLSCSAGATAMGTGVGRVGRAEKGNSPHPKSATSTTSSAASLGTVTVRPALACGPMGALLSAAGAIGDAATSIAAAYHSIRQTARRTLIGAVDTRPAGGEARNRAA
jgi:hypothetical protein